MPAGSPGFDHEGFIALAGFMLAGNSDNIAFLFLPCHFQSPSFYFFINVIDISRLTHFGNDAQGLQFRNLRPCLFQIVKGLHNSIFRGSTSLSSTPHFTSLHKKKGLILAQQCSSECPAQQQSQQCPCQCCNEIH